jgi:hypothetical protein
MAFSVSCDGSNHDVEPGATGFDLFASKTVVAMRVNGELKDLAHPVAAGDTILSVEMSSPDGLSILRHSTAHVLAQAVQSINPEAKLGIGPPIKDGFYYDFDVAEAFTPEDLKALEKAMERIIRSGQRFVRRVTNEADAAKELAAEPYKLELISLPPIANNETEADGDDYLLEWRSVPVLVPAQLPQARYKKQDERVLVNMLEGGFISQHDYDIGKRIASIFGGGEIEQGLVVSEDWLLDLELKYFLELVKMPKTQDRIVAMLKNGKPLRN